MTEHLRHSRDRRIQRVHLGEAGLRFTLGLVIVAAILVEDVSKFFGVKS